MTAVSEQLKLDVTIPAEGGIELGAWLFLPEGDGIRPAITMAHGFGGTKEHGLERFALAFAATGFVVLVHDHRNFGTSGGDLRGDIDPWQQIADWRRAISYLESRPEVDATRIGLWGTSYAGGHALVLGATDRRLRCVVAQVPTISGYEQGLRRVSPDATPALEHAFNEDERGCLRGELPRREAVVSGDLSVPAAYRSPDAIDFYLQPVPEGLWKNEVTLRSTRAARMYEPGMWVSRVSPTPLLMVVARDDRMTVTDLALEASRMALKHAGIAAEDLDCIIQSSTLPDLAYPAPGCVMQGRLGLTSTPVFNLAQGCAGFVYGLALAPVIKVSSRTALAERWPDLIDLDAGRIATGSATIESVGWELFSMMLDVASGRKKTWAEHWRLQNSLALFNPGPVT